jgi:hypothetical protein
MTADARLLSALEQRSDAWDRENAWGWRAPKVASARGVGLSTPAFSLRRSHRASARLATASRRDGRRHRLRALERDRHSTVALHLSAGFSADGSGTSHSFVSGRGSPALTDSCCTARSRRRGTRGAPAPRSPRREAARSARGQRLASRSPGRSRTGCARSIQPPSRTPDPRASTRLAWPATAQPPLPRAARARTAKNRLLADLIAADQPEQLRRQPRDQLGEHIAGHPRGGVGMDRVDLHAGQRPPPHPQPPRGRDRDPGADQRQLRAATTHVGLLGIIRRAHQPQDASDLARRSCLRREAKTTA